MNLSDLSKNVITNTTTQARTASVKSAGMRVSSNLKAGLAIYSTFTSREYARMYTA